MLVDALLAGVKQWEERRARRLQPVCSTPENAAATTTSHCLRSHESDRDGNDDEYGLINDVSSFSGVYHTVSDTVCILLTGVSCVCKV